MLWKINTYSTVVTSSSNVVQEICTVLYILQSLSTLGYGHWNLEVEQFLDRIPGRNIIIPKMY